MPEYIEKRPAIPAALSLTSSRHLSSSARSKLSRTQLLRAKAGGNRVPAMPRASPNGIHAAQARLLFAQFQAAGAGAGGLAPLPNGRRGRRASGRKMRHISSKGSLYVCVFCVWLCCDMLAAPPYSGTVA